ncbi:MAG: hypothetical protein R6V67_00695, partial [Spirochaetia bacterium]
LRGRYRDHREEDEDIDISNYHEQNKSLNRFSLDNKIILTGALLEEYRELDKSSITYTLDSRYLTYSYDENAASYEHEYLTWDEDSVRTHEMKVDIIRTEEEDRQSIFFEGSLPPKEPDNTAGVSAEKGPLEGEVRFRFRKQLPEEERIYGPLDASVRLNLWEDSYIRNQAHLLIPEEDDYYKTTFSAEFLEGSLRGSQEFNWNIPKNRAERAKSSLHLWFLTAEMEYRYLSDYTFTVEDHWQEEDTSSFQAYRSSAKIDARYAPDPMWKNRLQVDTGLSASYYMDMQRFTDNILGIEFDINASIAEFFDFELSLRSENRSLYYYVPSYAERLEVGYKNVFVDLLRSLNIFNREDLLDTDFNLQSLSLSAVHHMNDWDLNLIYNGEPSLDDEKKKYSWDSEFTIMVQWKPVPEIRKEAEYSGGELLF